MVIEILVILTILILCFLSICAVIYIDVYNIRRIKDTEVNINLIEFEKCILPYQKETRK